MRVTRALAGSAVVFSTVLGLSLAATGPATATEIGTWRSYGNTDPITSGSSTWNCTEAQVIDSDVLARACALRSKGGGDVQAAVIMRNNRPAPYSGYALMDLFTTSGALVGVWKCPASEVEPNSWSVCSGRTLPQNSPVTSLGFANGKTIGESPAV